MIEHTGESIRKFNIKRAGVQPEEGWLYEYADEKYHFWFVEDHKPQLDRIYGDLTIRNAYTKRVGGRPASVAKADLPIIEENIRQWVDDHIPADVQPRPAVTFFWNLQP